MTIVHTFAQNCGELCPSPLHAALIEFPAKELHLDSQIVCLTVMLYLHSESEIQTETVVTGSWAVCLHGRTKWLVLSRAELGYKISFMQHYLQCVIWCCTAVLLFPV